MHIERKLQLGCCEDGDGARNNTDPVKTWFFIGDSHYLIPLNRCWATDVHEISFHHRCTVNQKFSKGVRDHVALTNVL